MPNWDGGVAANVGSYIVRLNASENIDSNNNYSTISWSLELIKTGSGFAYNLNNSSTWYAYVGGSEYSGTTNYDFRSVTSKTLGSGTTGAIYHDGDGSKTISVYGSFSGSGGSPLGNGNTGWQSWTLTNFVRVPFTPSQPALVSRDRSTITMSTSASVPSGAPGITSYTWQQSTDNVNWNTISGQTSSTLSWTGATATTQYYFRVSATNSEGTTGYSTVSALIGGAPNQPTTPTIERTGVNLNVGLTTPAANGSTLSTFTLEHSTASDFPSEGPNATVVIQNISSSSQPVNGLTPGTTYYLRYKVGSNRGDSLYSPIATVSIPPIPSAPTITTALTKQVRKVTVDWNAVTLNGAALSSYEVEARYSSDGGSTWDTSFTNIGSTNSSTTILTTSDLNIAKTYQFRVRAITDVGNSPYSAVDSLTELNSIFISAYGYRHDGTNFNTAIQFAARYTGDSGDSINVNGTTYTGWKTIENVKRYDGTEFISLTQ